MSSSVEGYFFLSALLTIIRCFDSGRLRGFRVPGSKFRRIPREELDHKSAGVFEDRDSPRRFVTLTDLEGRRIFVSVPEHGGDKLIELLETKGRQPIRMEATGITTAQNLPFEAAADKWELID